MKHITLFFTIFIFIISCKKEKEQTTDLNPLEKVAHAHGFKKWNKVETIKFTFNVDRDTTHFERSWEWNPKKNEVTAIKDGESLTFNRSQILSDEELIADKNFINDVYWLLAPYKLVWDTGLEYDEPTMAKAPISNDSLQKLTITYNSQGGYTPGDAYDFYLDENHEIKEWVYREDNSSSNCMITTWEDYRDYEGLKIATMHQNENGVFKLYFTNIDVTLTKN
ncbi:hypothetical protein [Galbibacter mesophilus]|uniref:hypothetical protein n=1 Tax=Galbibacter mesophilus TaxID=379069 RepID=UPI00191CEC3D|nr:hypothetical protein [Galbibacter mesophilus]MCM5661599.1 hypothetical protein [Galbibacter mesophilus]